MKSFGDGSVKPMVFDMLSVLLPTGEQTWLLRACLHRGESGWNAWQVWQEGVGNPRKTLAEDKQGIKWLLPLLYDGLQRNVTEAESDLLPYLRTAYFREELRSRTYRRICQEVLTALVTAEIPFLVLNGATLAEVVYGDWTLRHCNDVDILVHQEDQARAVSTLRSAGFTPTTTTMHSIRREATVVHTSGLPIQLHCDLFSIPYYCPPQAEIWARTVVREIAGVPVHILAPADMLLHICGEAACSRSRDTLRWVCDAWYIMQQSPNLDWDMLLDTALRSRLALPLSVMFGYLAKELAAPVPTCVSKPLAAKAAKATVMGIEAALCGARMGRRGTLRNLIRHANSWQAHAVLLKWILLPSPSYMRWKYSMRHPLRLPFYYVYRPVRFIARRMYFASRQRFQRRTDHETSVGYLNKQSL